MRIRAAIATAMLAGLLTACGSGSGTTPETVTVTESVPDAGVATETVTVTAEPDAGDAPEADDTTQVKPKKDSDIVDTPGSVDGFVGARDDATVDLCKVNSKGILKAEGTVTNPADEAQDYRIYVSAMTDDDTMGIKQVDVTNVEPGATGNWETSFDVSGDNLRCVLRVERFAPQG